MIDLARRPATVVDADTRRSHAAVDDDLPSPAGCRRSDRSHGPCGPVLAFELPEGADLLLLREDLAVIGDASELVGLDAGTGHERWRIALFVGAREARLVDGGDLLIAAVHTGLAAIEPDDGRVRWVAPLPAGPTTDISLPQVWVGDEGVLVHDSAGALRVFDRSDGRARWHRSPGQAGVAMADRPDADAVAVASTPGGLVTLHPDGLRLWHPDQPDPRWQRSARDLHLPVRDLSPAVDLGSDPQLRRRTSLDHSGEVTVLVTWPDAPREAPRDAPPDAPPDTYDARPTRIPSGPDVVGVGPDGRVRWRTRVSGIPCCALDPVQTSDDRIVLASGSSPSGTPTRAVILDAGTGDTLGDLTPNAGELVAVTADTTIWQRAGGLVGLDLRTGREAFRATGRIAALDPLLIAGGGPEAGSRAETLIAVAVDGPLAPADVSRPGPRQVPRTAAPSGSPAGRRG